MSDDTLQHDDTWDGTRSEGPGSRVGPYLLVSRIGEGGFGDVYEAEQSVPVRRRVAMKILKLGMDTREVIGRFALERQALAMMEHPHIARVLDAGATEGGRPYFVMELVDGEPITLYCDKLALPVEARLKLFEQVCAAVQHAHTKGVIHRDLKPGNVLVSTHDGQHYAKVIDFGIAKAISGDLSERTQAATRMDQVVGTPLYMSPEQARGSADIDTRSDIYALGVILYELLTGSTPVDRTRLMAVSLADTQRLICESEPPVPSARLAKAATTASGTFGYHATEARTLARKVRGELDWIVMKAIEKDRSRRYDTANAFADDVRRYLDGEPVLAAPPSAVYRIGKFVRRNKVPVTAGALVVLALVVGIVGFAWQARVAREQARLAEQRADELKTVSKFQEDMLSQLDPGHAGKLLSDDVRARYAHATAKTGAGQAERDSQNKAFAGQWQRVNPTDAATAFIDRTILKPAVVAIDRKFRGQPLLDASLRQVVADRYAGMGLYDQAMALQQQALTTRRRLLGEMNAETLYSVQATGLLLDAEGKTDDAEKFLREALVNQRRVLGEDDRATLVSLSGLAQVFVEQGKFDQAEAYGRDALDRRRRAFGEDDKDTLTSVANMAGLRFQQGRIEEAEKQIRDVLPRARKVYGEDEPETLALINNLGTLLMREGKLDQAEPFLRDALEKSRERVGDDHPDTVQSMTNLAGLLIAEDKLDAAEPLLREALAKNRESLGDDNENTLMSIAALGRLLVGKKEFAEAERLLVPAEAANRKVFAVAQPRRIGVFELTLGRARTGLHEFAAARDDLVEAQSLLTASGGASPPQAAAAIQALIGLYAAWDKQEPGKGYAASAAGWERKLADLKAGEGKPGN